MLLALTLLVLGCGDPEPEETDTGPATETGEPFVPPEWCPEVEQGRQEVTTTDASPYYVMHPDPDALDVPIVIFLPGGAGTGGSSGHATLTWDAFFDADPRGYRIVMPWVVGSGYPTSKVPPVAQILDEVLACWAGDEARVHLVGHSNGGYLAYNITGPELAPRLATITGAPGYFQTFDAEDFQGLAFHNAAGDDDPDWLEGMEDAHTMLQGVGIESQLTVWEDTAHTPGPGWDGRDGMFAFWDAHSRP